jgi:ribose transport system substrate-binding protein
MRRAMAMRLLSVLVIAAMLLPLATAPLTHAQTPAAKPDPANADKTLVWIPKATNSTYWLAVLDGAKKAAAELGYKEVLYKGMPSQTDIAGQVNLVNDMVSAKVAGIMIAATDGKALVDPIEKAIAAGVPVVTLDSGVDSQKPDAYIATDNVAAAALAADVLGKLINGKGIVGDLVITAGSQTGIEREKGFVDEMKAKSPDVQILPVQYSGGDVAKALNSATDMLTGNPDTVGFYGAMDANGTAIAQLIKQRNLKDKIKAVSFDVSPDQFQLFLDGYLDALVVQDPFQMGYRGVYAIDQVLHNQPITDKNVAIPAQVVTRDNLTQPAIYDLLASYGDIKSILDEKGIKKGG